ncbi:MAG: hypothetical protein JJU05_05275 [Verrucomicrobia bacterium]|nr:hypothetical protein [Verrucomicrobiota bacterium]MCH8525823.1 hypothetical protein [Kiritimatiellia bacterium]
MNKIRSLLSPLFVLLISVLMFGCEFESDSSESSINVEEIAEEVAAVDAENVAPSGNGQDEISMSGVVWLDANVSGWPITTQLNARVSGGSILLPYDKASSWPTARTRASNGSPLVGNVWIFVNRGGTWYAATWDWMRPGQTAKSTSAVRGTGGHIRSAPLNNFTPRSGETYGFMVSTPARSAERTINQRSNVSLVVWP